MRLVGLIGVAGWAVSSMACAQSLAAQQAAARAAAFAPQSISQPTPYSDAAFGGDNLAWLSQSRIKPATANESFTLSTVSQRVAAGAVLGPQSADTLEPVAYDLNYTRSWPAAYRLAAGKFDVDVSPHAGVGAGDRGRSAEAGVTVRFGKNLGDKVAQKLGVKDSAQFGGRARWYIFAASSGKAVGYNLLRNDGDWQRAGVTQDAANALIGDAQAGFGWRKGPMQAALGYVHRDVKIRQGLEGLMGAGDRSDQMVALSFSIKQN